MGYFAEKIEKISGRVPANYLAHDTTTRRLMDKLNVDNERELLDALNVDFYFYSARDISQNEGIKKCYVGNNMEFYENERICPLGIRWTRKAFSSKFSVDEAIVGIFNSSSTIEEILAFKFPNKKDFDFSVLAQEYDEFKDKITIGGLWTGIMGDCYRMYGFQNFLMDLVLRPEVIKVLIDRITDMYLELNEKYFTQLDGKIDIWFFGNDFGSQNAMLFSVDMWKEFFFENIKKLCDLAHKHNIKVMMHSCGSIFPIIPYLIEAGVDILDPIQVTAKDMNIELLSQNFSGKIIFHGGIDTQGLLPFSSEEEVIKECKRTIDILGKNKGYIFTGSQILGHDIPTENIIAMYKANSK